MELSALGQANDEQVTLHRAVGCKHCNQQGYRGRLGIYEFIEVDDGLRKMIHDGTGEQEMTSYCRQSWPSILDDGKRRVLAGDTTLEEVMRVTVN
jgi:general secretion pathway protein E